MSKWIDITSELSLGVEAMDSDTEALEFIYTPWYADAKYTLMELFTYIRSLIRRWRKYDRRPHYFDHEHLTLTDEQGKALYKWLKEYYNDV